MPDPSDPDISAAILSELSDLIDDTATRVMTRLGGEQRATAKALLEVMGQVTRQRLSRSSSSRGRKL
jgi:hypothetical protein